MKKNIFFFIAAVFILDAAQAQQSGSVQNYFKVRDEWLTQLQNQPKATESGNTGEENQYTQFERWQWFWEPRVGPAGNMINPAWLDLHEEMNLEKEINLRSATSGNWTSCGPNHITCGGSFSCVNPGIGRVNCLAFDGSNVYAGSASGGAWKYDGTWHSLTDCIPNLTVSGICVDYTNSNNIYLLTGDGGNGNNPDGISNAGTNSMGLLKSTDGGVSWNITGLTFNISSTNFLATKLIMHPTDPNKLFVTSNQGIHKSIDGGLNWSIVDSSLAGEKFTDIVFKPGSPAIMYATSNLGFYRSTNTGGSWSAVALPFTVTSGNFTAMAIGVSPANASVVYLLVGKHSVGYFGLYKSINSGTSFASSPLDTTPNVLADEPSGGTRWQLSYDLVIGVDPTNINTVYVGGIDLYQSTDGGVTFNQFSDWNNIFPGSIHADQHAFEFSPSNEIYVGNDGGVYYNDGGWNSLFDGLDITQLRGLGLDATSSFNNSIMGGQDNGEMVYDGDDDFQEVWTGDGGDAVVDFTDHDRYYFNGNAQVWKQSCGSCVLGGLSPYAGCSCPDTGLTGDITPTPLVMDPANNLQIFFGYTCMFVTTDGGSTWSLIDALPCGGARYVGYAKGVTFDWAATKNQVFHFNPNGWLNRTAGLPIDSAYLTHVIVSPLNDDVAWVTFSGYKAGIKVFKTIDGGVIWSNVSGSLPNVPVNCIVRENGLHDGIYVGTDIGVYYRDNVLGDWIPFRNGMPSAIVTDLEISGVDNNIYATTFGRGLWKSSLVNTCESAITLGPFNALPAYSSYEAGTSITSQENANAGLGQSVNYKAGTLIDLLPGFKAINGSTLHAYTGACSNVSPRLASLTGYLNDPNSQGSSSANQNSNAPFLQADVYPDPFTDVTTLHLFISDSTKIQSFVTDIKGNVIYRFPVDKLKSGNAAFTWDAQLLPQGIYFLVIKSDMNTRVIKVVKI